MTVALSELNSEMHFESYESCFRSEELSRMEWKLCAWMFCTIDKENMSVQRWWLTAIFSVSSSFVSDWLERPIHTVWMFSSPQVSSDEFYDIRTVYLRGDGNAVPSDWAFPLLNKRERVTLTLNSTCILPTCYSWWLWLQVLNYINLVVLAVWCRPEELLLLSPPNSANQVRELSGICQDHGTEPSSFHHHKLLFSALLGDIQELIRFSAFDNSKTHRKNVLSSIWNKKDGSKSYQLYISGIA